MKGGVYRMLTHHLVNRLKKHTVKLFRNYT